MKASELVFDVKGNAVTGCRWGQKGGLPVIALHGWLDNCASFQFLAPQLSNVDLVALDLPGHGRSYHRSHLGAYNIWQDIADIMVVAEQLGWQQFALLGHSRGAMIATLIAATFPEKITHLALIESLVPEPCEAIAAPAQLASSINNLMIVSERGRRYYTSFERAVESRMRGFVPLDKVDAQALAERGALKTEKGFYWANDYKVAAPSEVKLTTEQLDAFLGCVSAPVILVVASLGMIKEFKQFDHFLSKVSNLTLVELEGHHHLHMSTQATAIAQRFNPFFTAKK